MGNVWHKLVATSNTTSVVWLLKHVKNRREILLARVNTLNKLLNYYNGTEMVSESFESMN
jgi:hypothetical protein